MKSPWPQLRSADLEAASKRGLKKSNLGAFVLQDTASLGSQKGGVSKHGWLYKGNMNSAISVTMRVRVPSNLTNPHSSFINTVKMKWLLDLNPDEYKYTVWSRVLKQAMHRVYAWEMSSGQWKHLKNLICSPPVFWKSNPGDVTRFM